METEEKEITIIDFQGAAVFENLEDIFINSLAL